MAANAVAPAALAYQDDLDRIESARPPQFLRLTALVVAFLVVSLIAASAITRVDMVVTGRGRLAADHPTAILQPMARAIIRTLLVRAGDPVRKGQVLATLDPTFTAADLASLQARQRSLVAEAARLLAEADATTYVVAPGASTEAALQANLFQQRQREHAARLDSFDQAIAHDAAERTTSLNQRAALAHQVAIAQAIMDLRKTLMQGAVGSRLQYLDAAAILARSAGELQALTDRLTELAHATASHSADRRAFIENWRREVLDTLADRRTTLAETDAAVAKAAHLADLISITAPEDGVVIDVAARAPGSILGEGDALLTLLPAHAGLQAELTIKSADIGYIREGDPVTLKIDAYPFQRHGALKGRVHAIAAASFDPDQAHADPLTAGAVHRVSVDITEAALADLPGGTGPMPGMTLSGDVNVGTRSVLAYFLAPITRGFRQSLREP